MFRVVYRSDLNRGVGPAEVELIAETGNKNNLELGINGVWMLSRRRALACLEGDPRIVRDMTERVWDDHRHANFELIDLRNTDIALFSNWGLKLVRRSEFLQDPTLTSHPGVTWLAAYAGGLEEFFDGDGPSCWSEVEISA